MSTEFAPGKRLFDRIDQLASISEHLGNITRRSLTQEHRQANDLVASWMQDAGMQVRTDAIGNIIGRYEAADRDDAPALLLGSHLDTVRDGGRFDGMLGVVTPIACVEHLHNLGKRLPYAIEIVGFSDEEGVRFPSTLLGSRAIAGTLDAAVLDERDKDDISIAQALRNFGQDPHQLHHAARPATDFLGFIEIHIEQGPVLERENLPVGLVTAIASAARYRVSVKGHAGHAGTVPMGFRHDALTGAAECILAIEQITTELVGAVGTVGQLQVSPGAGNVIPGEVEFLIDVRSADDEQLKQAEHRIVTALGDIARRRDLQVEPQRYYDAAGIHCDQWLSEQLGHAIKDCGHRLHRLPSGAGHDAMALAPLTRVAMMFVRCKDGLSHHPDESITEQDAQSSAQVLLQLLENFAPDTRPR